MPQRRIPAHGRPGHSDAATDAAFLVGLELKRWRGLQEVAVTCARRATKLGPVVPMAGRRWTVADVAVP